MRFWLREWMILPSVTEKWAIFSGLCYSAKMWITTWKILTLLVLRSHSRTVFVSWSFVWSLIVHTSIISLRSRYTEVIKSCTVALVEVRIAVAVELIIWGSIRSHRQTWVNFASYPEYFQVRKNRCQQVYALCYVNSCWIWVTSQWLWLKGVISYWNTFLCGVVIVEVLGVFAPLDEQETSDLWTNLCRVQTLKRICCV